MLKQQVDLSSFLYLQTKNTQNIVKMSGTMAQDKAQPSRLKQDQRKCRNELVTKQELLIGSVNRSIKNLRDFHYLEENGLSTRKLGFQIEESYDKLIIELEDLVEHWYMYIRLSVIAKEPQPQTDPEREVLKIEIDKQSKQIDEYKEMVNQMISNGWMNFGMF